MLPRPPPPGSWCRWWRTAASPPCDVELRMSVNRDLGSARQVLGEGHVRSCTRPVLPSELPSAHIGRRSRRRAEDRRAYVTRDAYGAAGRRLCASAWGKSARSTLSKKRLDQRQVSRGPDGEGVAWRGGMPLSTFSIGHGGLAVTCSPAACGIFSRACGWAWRRPRLFRCCGSHAPAPCRSGMDVAYAVASPRPRSVRRRRSR